MHTVIESIATANPPVTGSQGDGAAFMQKVTSLSPSIRKRIGTIYERSGIERRYSCIPDFLHEPDHFEFFGRNWDLSPAPGTAVRNEWYRRHAVPLAEEAARAALGASPFDEREITHLIAVSCTGFFAPGLDIELVKRLGLLRSTERTIVGFMGCYAVFNALRAAHAFCRSDPGARVLIVAVELCTLHFKVENTLESAVVNAIFSDGAAAAVLAARDGAGAAGKFAYTAGHCVLDDDSMEHMTWDIGAEGFEMGLSPRVPEVIARHISPFVDRLAARANLSRSEIDLWAIHPGGRAIVESAAAELGLAEDDVRASLEVLRDYGNMSSPTILFVLKHILERDGRDGTSGKHLAAMAFGPGLTIEGCVFSRISNP